MKHTNPPGKQDRAEYLTNPACACDACNGSRTFAADMERRVKATQPPAPVQAYPQDRERGLYGKYQISRADGKPIDEGALFFVIRYDAKEAIVGDKMEEGFTALLALRTYANAIRPTHPQLATDLITAIEAEGVKLRAYRDSHPGEAEHVL